MRETLREQPDAPPPMRLRDRMTRGIFWNFLSTLSTQGVTFGVNILIARILGKQILGQFSLLQTTVAALALVTCMGMGSTANKYIAQYASRDVQKVNRVLGLTLSITVVMGLAASVVVMGLSGWISEDVLKAPEMVGQLAFVSVGILLGSIVVYLNGVFAGLIRFRALALTNLICGGLYLLACGPAAQGYGLSGALTTMIAYYGIQCLVMCIVLRSLFSSGGMRFNIRQGLHEWKLIGTFSIPFAIANLSLWPTRWATQTMLFRLEDGDSMLGLYTSANQLRMLVVLVPFVITNFVWTLLNQQLGLGHLRRYRMLYGYNIAASLVITTLGVLGVFFLALPLLQLFGKEFLAGKETLFILLLSAFAETIALAVSLGVQSRGYIWSYLACMVIPRDVARIIAAYFLCPLFGSAGLAWSYLIGWCVGLLGIVALVVTKGVSPAPEELDASADAPR